MTAMLLSVLIAGVIATLALIFWPRRNGGPAGPAAGPGPVSAVLLPMPAAEPMPGDEIPPAPGGTPQATRSSAAAEAPRAKSGEGLLTIRFLDGELTREQYRNAMAALAAREEARNPMRLPGEIGPAPD